MGAIIIKADKVSSKILKQLAKKLRASVTSFKDDQYEEFFAWNINGFSKNR